MKGLCRRMDSHFYEWSGTFSGFRGLENSGNEEFKNGKFRGERPAIHTQEKLTQAPPPTPSLPLFSPSPPPRVVDTAIENLDTINFLIYQRQN